MPRCQHGDSKPRRFRQKVLYIVRHDGVGESIDCGFQYKFIVGVSQLWAQPAVEADSNGPCNEVIEEVCDLLQRLTVNLQLFRPAEYSFIFEQQGLREKD